jgi:hypothetical protein
MHNALPIKMSSNIILPCDRSFWNIMALDGDGYFHVEYCVLWGSDRNQASSPVVIFKRKFFAYYLTADLHVVTALFLNQNFLYIKYWHT